MKVRTPSDWMRIIINFICLLIFILPFSVEFNPEEYKNINEGWESQYLINDFENLIFIAPFFLVWFFYQFVTNRKLKLILKYISLILAAWSSFYGFLGIGMPIQDFVPDIGIHLLLLLFPLVLIMIILELLKKRKK